MKVPGYELDSEIPVSGRCSILSAASCPFSRCRPIPALSALVADLAFSPPCPFAHPQLGILFSVAAGASLICGVGGHFSYDQLMRRQAGFIYSGKPTQIVVWCICGLTIAACVLLLVAGDA